MKSVIAEREVGGWDKLKLSSPPPILKILLELHLYAHVLCHRALQDHTLEWEVGEFPPTLGGVTCLDSASGVWTGMWVHGSPSPQGREGSRVSLAEAELGRYANKNNCLPCFIFLIFLKLIFIYLAAPGLSCSMWDLVP